MKDTGSVPPRLSNESMDKADGAASQPVQMMAIVV